MLVLVEPLLDRLLGNRWPVSPSAGTVRAVIKSEMDLLPAKDLEKRVFFRKYSGRGDLHGLLDIIPPETVIMTWNDESHPVMHDHDFIIAPMHMDELGTLYHESFDAGMPVYPITHPVLNSKYYRNVMLGNIAPKTIYIPSSAFSRVKNVDFGRVLRSAGIDTVMIKDEFGFHSGQMVPYVIAPANKANDAIIAFSKRASRVVDVGGVVIDEFIGGTFQTIYKCHVFNGMIPGEVIRYDVQLKSTNGVFKDADGMQPDLLGRVDVSQGSIDDADMDMVSRVSKVHAPHAFTSIDVMFRPGSGEMVVIDVNSKAGSLGELQELNGSNDHDPFTFFMNKVSGFPVNEWKKQRRHVETLDDAFSTIRAMTDITCIDGSKMERVG